MSELENFGPDGSDGEALDGAGTQSLSSIIHDAVTPAESDLAPDTLDRPSDHVAITPSEDEIAAAKQVLADAGQSPPPTDPTDPAVKAAQEARTTELQSLQEDLAETAETSQLLSNISSMKHGTAMGIIGNMR